MLEYTFADYKRNTLMLMNVNTAVYVNLLNDILRSKEHELINWHGTFNVLYDTIPGTNTKYVANELAWYTSQDLCIKGHKGIENNKIWQSCATRDGMVNSNYGWCIFSKENGTQFAHAINALIDNKSSRQSCCYYTRPSIHDECHDDVHAHYDMICTPYTQHFIRQNRLEYIVNMRSNDAWYGLRNDLEWHKYVYERMFDLLKKQYPELIPGHIHWNAGSIHIYDRNIKDAKSLIEQFADQTIADCHSNI